MLPQRQLQDGQLEVRYRMSAEAVQERRVAERCGELPAEPGKQVKTRRGRVRRGREPRIGLHRSEGDVRRAKAVRCLQYVRGEERYLPVSTTGE